MELASLRIFRDVAYELSFIRAAKKNHLTQPAVSAYIKKLEESFGTRLFERTPNKVKLTPEGRQLLPYAEQVLRNFDSLRMAAGEIKNLPKGEIRIASIHSIGMYEIGGVLREYMQRFPGIQVHLQYRRAAEIYDMLKSKQVDLGLLAYPEKRNNFENLVYGEDRMVVVVPNGHPLAGCGSIDVEQLEGADFVAFDESAPTREAIDNLLKENGLRVNIRMTNDNIFALKKAVEIGIGLSIVPDSTIHEEIQAGRLVKLELTGIEIKRPLAIVRLNRSAPSTPELHFLDVMTDLGSQTR